MPSPSAEEHGLSAIPWNSSALYVILSSSLMGVMGVSLISPVLPRLQSVFVVSDAQIGLVITTYTLPGIFLTPFLGLVADRFGRRRVIVPLLFLFGISGAGISFATTFTEVLILRFLQGIGASALVTLAVTLIGDFYNGRQRDVVMGFNASMLGTGAAAYPLIGGGLAEIRWNFPFLFFGVGILIGLFALLTLPEPDGTESSDVKTYLVRLQDVVFHPHAMMIFVALFLLLFIFYGAIQTALPLLLSNTYNVTSGEIGVVLSGAALASATVSSQYGRISERRTAPELVALGFAAFGGSLLGIWLSSTPLHVGLSLLATGVAFGLIMPSIDTAIVTFVSDQLRAGMMGVRTSVLRLGQTLGPATFTYVAETTSPASTDSYRHLIVSFGIALFVAGVVMYVFLRR